VKKLMVKNAMVRLLSRIMTTHSLLEILDKKLIELTLKYSEREVAMYCPEFNKVDPCLKEDLKFKKFKRQRN